MLKVVSLIFVGIAVWIPYALHAFYATLGYDKKLTFSDETCELLEFPTPLEDMTQLGDGHCIFAGAGDLGNLFSNGSAHAESGAIWLINITSGSIEKLHVSGSAVPSRLILHGLYFSQVSKRLYAVNHDPEEGESVQVFDVLREGLHIHLKHRISIRSPLFQHNALNDVVEGVSNEIYVTEWQPFGLPPGGKESSSVTSLASIAMTPITILKIRLTRVFRCTFNAAPTCTIASTTRFVGANGIAVSEDRQTFFVNDAPAGIITVMNRQSDGTLKASSQILTKHNLDNIEMTRDGKLSGGAILLPYTTRAVCEDAKFLSRTKVVGGREVGCGKSPGGHLEISLFDLKSSLLEDTQVDGVIHDGSKLQGIASSLRIRNKTVFGSYYEPGLLVCEAQRPM